jgi:hypothetical protein
MGFAALISWHASLDPVCCAPLRLNSLKRSCQMQRSVIYPTEAKTMHKTILNEVCDFLLENELVASESEFSRDWLCCDGSYMRGLRFCDKLPSVMSIAVCASKLEHYGQRLQHKGGHNALSDRLLELSEACREQIELRARAKWVAAREMDPAA